MWRAKGNLHSGGQKEEEEERDPKMRFPIPLSSLCLQWPKDPPLGSAFFCAFMRVEGRVPRQESLLLPTSFFFFETELKLINSVTLTS